MFLLLAQNSLSFNPLNMYLSTGFIWSLITSPSFIIALYYSFLAIELVTYILYSLLKKTVKSLKARTSSSVSTVF